MISYFFYTNTYQKMNRLSYVANTNPEWAQTIIRFFEAYPEFADYSYRLPLRPIEPVPYTNVNNLFQAVLHYVCATGVRYSYAVAQWITVYEAINVDTWEQIMVNVEALRNNPVIQNKKRELYYQLCSFMNQNGIDHISLSVSHLPLLQKNVKGIGEGCVAWCRKYFSTEDDCVEYTDIGFKKGFLKLYKKDSLSERKKKSKEWVEKGFGRIANLMVLAISV